MSKVSRFSKYDSQVIYLICHTELDSVSFLFSFVVFDFIKDPEINSG